MAETENKDPKEPKGKKEDEGVVVPMKLLQEMQAQIAAQDVKIAEQEAKNAGLEQLFSESQVKGEAKLREKKTFEPKFRTVRLRKYPKNGGESEYVIGYTDRGAYEIIDRSGISPEKVNMIEIFFYGEERSKDGKLKAEQVKLLDLMNAPQVVCKVLGDPIIKNHGTNVVVPTGEEIDTTVWDPQHGLVSTGDKIDGFVTYSDIKLEVQTPDGKVIKIDQRFANM